MPRAAHKRATKRSARLCMIGALVLALMACASDQVHVDQQLAEAEFNVEGMTCGSCERRVQTAARSVPGVVAARASHTDARVWVTFDAIAGRPELIAQAIRKAGYHVETISKEDPPRKRSSRF
ncbi:MAG: cation transporter [Proteobacteria bacterium]|nr:cation transporter [Pseudomonadota bacterium]